MSTAMAEKDGDRESPVPGSPTKSEDADEPEENPLELLQSDSSESESESRKGKPESKTKKKRVFKGDRIDKSLSELAKETAKVYQNKDSGNFVTGFNVHSKEAKQKKRDRAKRFGLPSKEKARKSEDLSAIILPPDSTIGGDKIRPGAIFISGVNDMSTQDVFNYFKEYDPSSIEWINDSSCNVVWLDPHSAARALYHMSQPQHILPQPVRLPPPQPASPPVREEQEPEPMEQEEEDDEDDILDLVSDLETGEQERQPRSAGRSPNPNSPPAPCAPSLPLPSSSSSSPGRGLVDDNSTMEDDMDMGPVHLSREKANRTAVPCPMANGDLVIRYATTADKKALESGHRSQYYIKYGNPNFGGMKGLISGSLKKRIREGKFVPGQRKRRYGDDDASDDEDRQEYARKRCNHGNWGDSQPQRRMEERDSDGDGAEMDLRLLTKPAEPRRPRRMYADDLEEKIKTIRKQTTDATPQIVDAREHIKTSRPPAASRLGYHAASEESSSDNESDAAADCFPSGDVPNLKIMVDNNQCDSWDEEDEEEEDKEEAEQQRGLQDLRSRLKSRRTNPQFLDTLPSLSIQVDRDDF